MKNNNGLDVGDEDLKWSGSPATASQASQIMSGFVFLPVGIGIIIFIGVYINLNYTKYAITDKALYKKTGMLSNKTKRVPLSKIQNTEYSRSWIEKQFEFGTVKVSTAGSSGKELSFKSVSNPKEVQDMISKLSKQNKNNAQQNLNNHKNKKGTHEDIKEEITRTRKNLEEIVEHFDNKE
jgi:uncharacterized membrane protein YdbT with pleckstrin-like domain